MLTAVLALLALGCQPAAQLAPDYAAMYSPAVDAYFDVLFSPNFSRAARGQAGDATGMDELKPVMTGLRAAYSDAVVTNDESYFADGVSFHHWTFNGTNDRPLGDLPTTGKSAKVSSLTIMRYQDRKPVEEIVCWDDLELNQQLGFTLVPPAVEKAEG